MVSKICHEVEDTIDRKKLFACLTSQAYTEYASAILLNGPIIVDTFFTISGFLTSYFLLQAFKKRKNISVIALYIHRFVRLMPMYLAVVVFYCTIFVKIGSGALWMEEVGKEQLRCLQSWWANLLFINNYVQVDNLCMVQSWYITNDFHFFVIGTIIVKLLMNKPAIGKLVIFGGITASAACIFYITYVERLDPILMLYIKTLNDPVKSTLFRHIYIPSHTRATPYLIGLAAGYIRYQIKISEYVMSRKLVWICWIVGMACIEGSVWTSWFFYQPGFTEYSHLFNAFFGATHRIAWSCGVSWMILAMSTGNGDILDVVFSWKPIVPFSRLSYSAFLCHAAIQLYTVASSRAPYYLSIFQLVYMSFADILSSYALAIPMTLLFEAPIIGLEKILVGGRR